MLGSWQVRASMPGGGILLFGVQAPDRKAAWEQAWLRLEGTGAIGMQVTRIPPPALRAERRRHDRN